MTNMADIELVIKISEEDYDWIKRTSEGNTCYPCTLRVYKAIANGTPQQTGHWIEHEHNGILHIECSECSSWFLRAHLLRNSYCPNCGVRMENKKSEGSHESN